MKRNLVIPIIIASFIGLRCEVKAQSADTIYSNLMTPQQEADDSVLFEHYFPYMVDSANNDFFGNIDTVNKVYIESINTVKYVGYANAYLKLNVEGVNRNIRMEVLNSAGNFIVNYFPSINDSSFYFTNLPLEDSLVINVFDNVSGLILESGKFSTYTNYQDDQGLAVSPELFEILGIFSQNSISHDADELYSQLISNTQIPIYERLSFIQSYYLRGDLFDQGLDPIFSPTPAARPSFPSDGGVVAFPDVDGTHIHLDPISCNCQVITTRSVGSPKDGIINANTHDVSPSYSSPQELQDINIYKGKYHTAYSREGAARYEQVYLFHNTGNSSFAPTPENQSYSDSAMTPYYSRLGFNMLCVNLSGYPSNLCRCMKDVYYNYKYDTRIWTDIEPRQNSFLVTGHGGYAEGEDYAVLIKSDFNGGFNILDAGRYGTEQSFSNDFNGHFFKSLTGIAKTVAGVLSSPSNFVNYLNLLGDLGNFFSDSSNHLYATTGSQGAFWSLGGNPSSIIAGQNSFALNQNTPTYLTMYSFGSLYTHAWNKTNTSSKTVSDYDLGAYIYCGLPDGQGASCSTNGIANWMVSGFDGDEPSYMADLNMFFGTLGYTGYPNTETGPFIKHCNEPYYNQNLQPINDKIAMNKYSVAVYNILGVKILSTETYGLPTTNGIDSKLKGFAAGTYIYTYIKNNRLISEKIFHNN